MCGCVYTLENPAAQRVCFWKRTEGTGESHLQDEHTDRGGVHKARAACDSVVNRALRLVANGAAVQRQVLVTGLRPDTKSVRVCAHHTKTGGGRGKGEGGRGGHGGGSERCHV